MTDIQYQIATELNRGRKYGTFGTATLRVADHIGNEARFDNDFVSVSVLSDSIHISIRKNGVILSQQTLPLLAERAIAFVESFESTFEDIDTSVYDADGNFVSAN